jgi:siderophore synthetase component
MKPDMKPLSKYQAIWARAKRNGTVQDFDSLPAHKWQWPTATFLQRRLAELKKRQIKNPLRVCKQRELRSNDDAS